MAASMSMDSMLLLLRFALATVANMLVPKFLYRFEYLPQVRRRTEDWMGQQAGRMENRRFPKLNELWPPHQHFLIYFGFSYAIYFLYKNVLRPKSFGSLLLMSLPVSFLINIFLVPVMRMGEMHIWVIFLNFVHCYLSCLLSSIVMFIFTPLDMPEKAKTE